MSRGTRRTATGAWISCAPASSKDRSTRYPDVVRQAVLDRIKTSGFSRRCPCLYDPEHGFQGYESHSYSNGEDEVDDYDERNSVKDCELCGGSGNYDPLPKLLELTDDKAAEAWIVEELPRSSGPCDHWTGLPGGGLVLRRARLQPRRQGTRPRRDALQPGADARRRHLVARDRRPLPTSRAVEPVLGAVQLPHGWDE